LLLDEAAPHPGDEQLDVAAGQLLGDRPFVGEELIDGTDRDPGSLGYSGRGERLVADLVEELGAGVEHPLDAAGAAALGGLPAERLRMRTVTFQLRCGHVLIFPLLARSLPAIDRNS